jgi:hypothetical protein
MTMLLEIQPVTSRESHFEDVTNGQDYYSWRANHTNMLQRRCLLGSAVFGSVALSLSAVAKLIELSSAKV